MVEGLTVYKEMLDNIKYLDTFISLYSPHREYAMRNFKFQRSARNRQYRAQNCVELLDTGLQPLRNDCEKFAKYLKSEQLNNILDLEEDLEWIYLEINQRFVKIFNGFSQLTEDVKYLKEAEERLKLSKRKKLR